MKAWSSLFAALITAVLLAASTVPPYSALYVFGDSYSDIGEGYLDCDGPTAVFFLAERLGLKLLPSSDPQANNRSSIDFAVSGAQTGSGEGKRTGDALLSFGMRNQVDSFSRLVQAHTIEFQPESTLFFVAGGLNDRKLPTDITVTNLEDEIKQLYALGGRHFRLALLPTAIPSFSEVGLRLNPAIEKIPSELLPQLPGSDIKLSHWGPFFDDVMKNPADYGIKNTTDPCAGRAIFQQDATPCADPAAHFYFHAGHPSMAVHRIVGQKLYRELTEPAP